MGIFLQKRLHKLLKRLRYTWKARKRRPFKKSRKVKRLYLIKLKQTKSKWINSFPKKALPFKILKSHNIYLRRLLTRQKRSRLLFSLYSRFLTHVKNKGKKKDLKKAKVYSLLFSKLKGSLSRSKNLFSNRIKPRFRIPKHYRISYSRNQALMPLINVKECLDHFDTKSYVKQNKSFVNSYLKNKYFWKKPLQNLKKKEKSF